MSLLNGIVEVMVALGEAKGNLSGYFFFASWAARRSSSCRARISS